MMFASKFVVLLLAVVAVWAKTPPYERFEGYKVLQVNPENENQLLALQKMSTVLGFEVDFWRETGRVGRFADFMVSPKQVEPVVKFLADYGIKPKVMVEDVSKLVDRSMGEVAEQSKRPQFTAQDSPRDFALDQYHTHAEINAYLQSVASANTAFVQLMNIGKSLQNRDMLCLKIGTPRSGKNAVFIDAGIHAREWVAPATALYTIDQLVSGYSGPYRTLLDAIDVYVCPQINPDGYEFSRTSNRMWRKTRSGPVNGCYGVDPNRNWSYYWGYSGTSSSPCSEIYKGASAFSEIECTNVRRVLDGNAQTIKAYLTLHSYGEDFIYPWGYAQHTYPPDVADLRNLGNQVGAAIRQVHGTQYIIDNSADSLYPAAGASDDYSKSIGIKWVYTMELRPGSGDTDNDHQYGFDLPAQFIMPTATEAFAGLMVVMNRVMTGPN